MRYSLKNYQEDAIADILNRLRRAREDWHQGKTPGAFSLTATTGSGKTVMAAAVIEGLFSGYPEHDFDPDPSAAVLWFTDDPSLNQQTRFRLLEAADRITSSRLVVIEKTFNQEKLEPGNIYFLNAQKLGKKSLLVRGDQDQDGDSDQTHFLMPDARAFTMWDTLANTIADENITLYLILDEAHRGMKRCREKATIVQRLVNGSNGVPPVPVVWGISATVERFNHAMAEALNRTSYPPVIVPPEIVQESGLLKDDIRLEFPTKEGSYEMVLLGRATRQVEEASGLWNDYAKKECIEPVVPLLVVQVPNTPTDELLTSAFRTIHDNWQGLDSNAMAHVFGEHKPIDLAGFKVPYVAPETVQDETYIRVLFAKDAISTGWDCPRAEVLVSFRHAKDETHITQLLGRMVRTPLARRVPGNDLLNSVTCVLPYFDQITAANVARNMLGERDQDGDGTGGGSGRRVLFSGEDMNVNSVIPKPVWDVFDQLPSQTVPRRSVCSVRRLLELALALSRDGLRKKAHSDVYKKLISKLNGLMAQHQQKVTGISDGILQVEGETLIAHIVGGDVYAQDTFTETADALSVEANFQVACRVLNADIAKRYVDHLAREDEEDDGLFKARVKVAALAQIEGVSDELNQEANQLCTRWFDEYRVAIKDLSDERQAVYDTIKGLSSEPQVTELKRPRVRIEATQNEDGQKLEVRDKHLMSNTDGNFPIASLNTWEIRVLDKEMDREGFVAWYRNPARPSSDALAIPYRNAQGDWRRMCPDFIFFHYVNQQIKASIVDPHGPHLDDALPKLQGLANFAKDFGDSFHRIESVASMPNGVLRVLDLTEPNVREAIHSHSGRVQALYESQNARDY